MSRIIRRLEQHLGFDLFLQKPRGVELTGLGLQLRKVVHQGFKNIREELSNIYQAQSSSNTVLLSVSSAFVIYWLMPRVSRLNSAYPEIELQFQLISGDPTGDLTTDDLGIQLEKFDDEDVAIEHFVPEVILTVCLPAYADRAGTLDDQNRPPAHTHSVCRTLPTLV